MRRTLAVTLCLALAAAAWALESRVTISVRDGWRYITSNGIPGLPTGRFPNPHNPNTIRPQRYRYRIPESPRANAVATPMRGHPIGVAVNGVPFDPGTAEFWRGNPLSGWNYDALSGRIDLGLDVHNAHVQPSGAYHYHGIPVGLVRELGADRSMVRIGYAADGFPIYGPVDLDGSRPSPGYRLRQGTRPGGPGGLYDGTFVQDYEYLAGRGDLDECNGHLGPTPEQPDGAYHYHVTESYPFMPRCFRGTPDPSFFRHRPPPR